MCFHAKAAASRRPCAGGDSAAPSAEGQPAQRRYQHRGAPFLRYGVVVAGREFNVVFEDAGHGWVYAHAPDLPEVQTQGESLDDARRMAREAIELVLDERLARGEPIPETGWAIVESVEIAA